VHAADTQGAESIEETRDNTSGGVTCGVMYSTKYFDMKYMMMESLFFIV
jgi:hypothetical protein